MKNIFIGFILIFLDFSLNLGNSKIGLIPDFIGYIIMIKGLEEMAEESNFFIKIKPFVAGMAIYSGILYFMDLIGASVSLGTLTYLLAFMSIVVSLYISYHIVMGVIEMEGTYQTFLNGNSLKSTWQLLAIFNVLSLVSLLIPVAAIFFILASFVVAVCFLVAFSNSKNRYYEIVR
ncbi:MAG: hypothetical protein WBI07_16480 [Mobilitalea sp.]